MGETAVQRARFRFRHRHPLIDRDAWVAAALTQESEDFLHGIVRRVAADEPVAYGNRAGVGERVARFAFFLFELDERVESRSGGLTSDVVPKRRSNVPQRDRQGEDRRNALDRERLVAIAGNIGRPVGKRDRDAEFLGIDVGERRNVARDIPVPAINIGIAQHRVDERLIVDRRLVLDVHLSHGCPLSLMANRRVTPEQIGGCAVVRPHTTISGA